MAQPPFRLHIYHMVGCTRLAHFCQNVPGSAEVSALLGRVRIRRLEDFRKTPKSSNGMHPMRHEARNQRCALSLIGCHGPWRNEVRLHLMASVSGLAVLAVVQERETCTRPLHGGCFGCARAPEHRFDRLKRCLCAKHENDRFPGRITGSRSAAGGPYHSTPSSLPASGLLISSASGRFSRSWNTWESFR